MKATKKPMKAAILERIDGPLAVGEVELTDLVSGQVLVKVLVSGICGAQLQEIAGNKGNAKFVPHLLGHEGCGIVEAVAPDVTTVKVGDKVVMHWMKGDGIEADFPTYILNGKSIRSGKVTTFSEYSIVSENRLTAVPHETPNDLCALLGCGLSTALGVMENEAQVKPGESVMIVGAGGLGLNLLNAAVIAGAKPIVLVDVHESKRKMAEALGAHLFINSKERGIKESLTESLNIKDLDVIVDTSGNKHAVEATLPLLGGNGRYIFVGQPKPGETIELKNAHHMFDGKGKTIKATQGGKFNPTKDIPRYLQMHKSGALKIHHIISHRIQLDKINEAIDMVRNGQAGRIIIDICPNK